MFSTIPKVFFPILNQKGSKALEEIAFSQRPFLQHRNKLWRPLAFFKKIDFFLNFIKGFQNIYGYGGLKLQSKREGWGQPPPREMLRALKYSGQEKINIIYRP